MVAGQDELKPGTDFAGKYTIESTIGAGGMGVVYRALHRRLEQQVAIKMLLPSMLTHAQVVARFEREARAAGQLRSRHTVRVLDVGEEPGHGPFMVMEYLHGHDLGTELEKRGPLPVEEAIEWLLQACSAMAEAHDRGIVHRDLKPANLFLAAEMGHDERILKVLDFGISKLDDSDGSSVTNTSVTMGTPLYMSPEQVRSTKSVDLRTDVWSLGIILYEILLGKTPFEGSPAAVGAAIVSDEVPRLDTLRRDVTPSLGEVIHRALAKKRDQRYPDARAFAAALKPWSARAATSLAKLRPSDPRTTAAFGDEERAPTLAFGVAPAPPPITPPPDRPNTAIEWSTGHSAPRKRTGLVFGGAAALLIAVVGGAIALKKSQPPPTAAMSEPSVSAPPHVSAEPPPPPPIPAVAVVADAAPSASVKPTIPVPSAHAPPPPPAPRPHPSTKPASADNPNRL